MGEKPTWRRALISACVTIAALRLSIPVLGQIVFPRGPGDFLSYYYGARVASSGGNPYDLALLNELSIQETGKAVNPYLYPPPFLLAIFPLSRLPVGSARIAWCGVELLALTSVLVLLRRLLCQLAEQRDLVVPLLALVMATYSPVYDDLVMGQVNFVVLALLLLGLHRLLRSKDLAAGVLLGAAVMIKVSPALLLVWLLVKRRWRALFGAAAILVLLSVASLPMVGLAHQRVYYGQVLPGFSERFPQVKLRIDWIGNHSLPSALNALAPGAHPMKLSRTAQAAAAILETMLLAATVWLCLPRSDDPRMLAAEGSLFIVPMVAFPVFAYDHHLNYLLLPIAVSAVTMRHVRMPTVWAVALGVAYALVALPLHDLAGIERWQAQAGELAPLLFMARKAKLLGMAILFATLVRIHAAAR